MPWIVEHECWLPDVGLGPGGIGALFGLYHKVGSIWECDDCGRRWRIVTRVAGNGRTYPDWQAVQRADGDNPEDWLV